MQSNKNKHKQIINYVLKIIILKTIDLKLLNKNITEKDVINYLLKIVLIDIKNIDISDIAYYIFNIKINKIIKFINNSKTVNSDLSLNEFKNMFIKHIHI